jgi:uncharacterized protein
MGKTVWIDLENSPHVPFFRPWIDWLRDAGHDVLLTARDLSQTHDLLRIHGLDFIAVGGHGGGGKAHKALRGVTRAASLARVVAGKRIALAMGHGSRAQVLAAAGLAIPSVTFVDYEYVALRLFGVFCRRIFFPDAVSPDVLGRRGVPRRRLVSYPGFKEQIYLDPRIDRPHPADPPLVLVRPPARLAHYHTPLSEVLYHRVIERLTATPASHRVLFLPRYAQDLAELRALAARHPHVSVAEAPLLGKDLLLSASLVVSGGGTMVREAAVLGIPAASFFGGPVGGVDEALTRAGRLWMLRSVEDADRLPLPGETPASTGVMAGAPAALPDVAVVRDFVRTRVLELIGKRARGAFA